ncbi:hypothetical protein TFLX_05415 [Thermoflexales bacterium]|nr:hypothetical protein TFLX_05415 [Thermoflexales bacterium]
MLRKLAMNDMCIYHILIKGQVALDEINVMSPLQITLERIDTATTLFSVRTDQSGLIGLLRHLHARGVMLLAIHRER